MAKQIEFRVELANRVERGRCVGNLWGVARLVGGCRGSWVFGPQPSEDAARAECARLNAETAS